MYFHNFTHNVLKKINFKVEINFILYAMRKKVSLKLENYKIILSAKNQL